MVTCFHISADSHGCSQQPSAKAWSNGSAAISAQACDRGTHRGITGTGNQEHWGIIGALRSCCAHSLKFKYFGSWQLAKKGLGPSALDPLGTARTVRWHSVTHELPPAVACNLHTAQPAPALPIPAWLSLLISHQTMESPTQSPHSSQSAVTPPDQCWCILACIRCRIPRQTS